MDQIINILEKFSTQVPLTIYAFVGGFVEELVAPIPSPLVMGSAGSIANTQGFPWTYIILIGAIAGVAKTIGAWIIYFVADKAEDIVLTKFGKFLGISHKEVEKFGKHFDNTWKDDVILILLRFIPFFPGAPVAAVAGLIRLNIVTYIRSTFIGVWLRSIMYGLIGYFGLAQLKHGFAAAESVGTITFLLVSGLGVVAFLYIRKKGMGDKIMKMLNKKVK